MSSRADAWPEGLRLRHELRPGDLGRLIALHGEVYSQWSGYGLEFEAFVARTIAEYGLDNGFNGRVWLLEAGQESASELVGCCAVALRGKAAAQLRWVLLKSEFCGGGLGRRLVETALDHCRGLGIEKVFLETTDGLEASSTLYEKLGFRESSNQIVPLWAGPRPLIRMELSLKLKQAGLK